MTVMERIKELQKDLPYITVLDNIDTGVLVYDRNGNCVFSNRTMIKWRDISRQEYMNLNVHSFMDKINVCVFDLVCQSKRKTSRLQYYTYPHNNCNKPKIRIVTGFPIFDNHGDIKYVICQFQDTESFYALHKKLAAETQILPTTYQIPPSEETNIIAHSPEFRQLLDVAKSVANISATILICGESGCGKEVIAQYIHRNSDRKNEPMITVNCAALSESLIEAELYGYEKGSFTGASRDGKVGLIEAADGGILFLDEINSLPLSLQGKLLRTIEEKSVQRVGSVQSKHVDFRLISATNQDLEELVRQKLFRADLYYRLNVIPLTIPPVRNRKSDIIPLFLHFLDEFCHKYGIMKHVSENVLTKLSEYDWPGNVREIRNFAERIVVMTSQESTVIQEIPTGMLLNQNFSDSNKSLDQHKVNGKVTKELILSALERCDYHRAKTAEYLGISRRQLQYKIREYHIPSRCHYEDSSER